MRGGTALLSAVALSAGLAAMGCGADNADSAVWDRNADVYAVGTGDTMFKNGAAAPLDCGGDRFVRAESVFVSGGDVYVAGVAREPRPGAPGNIRNYAVLWKNGEIRRLGRSDEGSDGSAARSVFVSGGDVYVAGHENYRAVVWVNGAPHMLEDSPIWGSEASSVFVSDGDVYAGGDVYFDGCIWKNGALQVLYYSRNIDSVFVSGGDVYAVGNGGGFAMLFKNGERQDLSDGARTTFATSVFVSGDDVYVAGGELVPIYDGEYSAALLWKNGVRQELRYDRPDVGSSALAYSVFVLGADVFVAGYAVGPGVPMLWANGVPIDLRPYGIKSGLLSVFAVEKGE